MTNLVSIALLSAGFLGMWVCALYAVDFMFSFVGKRFSGGDYVEGELF